MKHALLAFSLLAFSAPGLAGTTVKAVVDEWAPFGGESLPNQGISLDVMTAVLDEAGYTVDAHIVPWERALRGVQYGTYDVIGNLFPETEMSEYLLFSDPIYRTEVRFIQRVGGDATFTDVESLSPYRIAVGEGYFYEPAFDSADYLDKTTVTTVVQGVRMVASGRVDLTLDSVDVINHVINEIEPDLKDKVVFLPVPLAKQAIHMGVRKDMPGAAQLVTDFNRVLQEMEGDGRLAALLEKHQR